MKEPTDDRTDTSAAGAASSDARAPRDTHAPWDTDALRDRLSPLAWRVTQESGTEAPFTGEFWDHFAAGDYHCIVCGALLFESDDKFHSHCGWPSFSEVAAQGRVTSFEDFSHGMHRIEVRCATCGAHLGHVFPDGPTPTGLRYCINSAALTFEPTVQTESPANAETGATDSGLERG